MRILVAHNFYQQPGGEDEVFRTECDLLRSYGHDVHTFTVHNDDVEGMSHLKLVKNTIWNRDIQKEIRALIRAHDIELVHFHNTFPLISPAAYSAARAEGAAVVQTLHNFRLLCANALLFRDGRVCEDCLNKSVPWPAVVHKCYRGSLSATAVVAATLTIHRIRRTWADDVDALIATTNFAREKFVANGLPADKIIVKPNFLHPEPQVAEGKGNYAVFVGRLSHEKGLQTLLDAWTKHEIPLNLKIIGDGPLADQVRAATSHAKIDWLGRKPLPEVYDIIGDASLLIFPSECYETFGRVAIEAFAKGTPVIATSHGAAADVVEHGRTGLLFRPGDAAELAQQVNTLLRGPALLSRMRQQARAEFEARYTGFRAHEQLMQIYRRALDLRHPNRAPILTPQVTS